MLLRIITLSILFGPLYGYTQGLSKDFVSLNALASSGNGLIHMNTSLHQNAGLGRKHRAHIVFGARASFIRNSNTLIFSPARFPEPDFTNNGDIVTLGTLNLLAGIKVNVTSRLSLGANTEVLGITFGSKEMGTMAFMGNTYEFEAKPTATNFLLNGNAGGNLFHCFEAAYLLNDKFMLKAGVGSQSIVYNYRSNLDGFSSFSRSHYATTGFIGLEWIVSCKR